MDLKLLAKQKDSEAEALGQFVARPNVNIPEQRLKDLICCGIEGGIGYWAEIYDYEFGSGFSSKDFLEGGKMTDPKNYWHPSQLIPFVKGCSVVLQQTDVEAGEEADVWRLNRQALVDGLTIMMNKYPRHAANFLDENEDAETGDVFIQCCLLGEIVYG
jgi:hypothetical protein